MQVKNNTNQELYKILIIKRKFSPSDLAKSIISEIKIKLFNLYKNEKICSFWNKSDISFTDSFIFFTDDFKTAKQIKKIIPKNVFKVEVYQLIWQKGEKAYQLLSMDKESKKKNIRAAMKAKTLEIKQDD